MDMPATTASGLQSYYDSDDAYSFTNLVTPELARDMQRPEIVTLLYKGEDYIKDYLQPTTTMHRIKTAWWLEYDRALAEMRDSHSPYRDRGTKFIKRVAGNVCSYEYLCAMLQNPYFLSWLMIPIVDYQVAVEEALTASVDRMRELLTMPLLEDKLDKDGMAMVGADGKNLKKPDYKAAEIFMNVVQYLDKRVKGAIAEKTIIKSESRVLTHHTKGGSRTMPAQAQVIPQNVMSIEDVERRLQAIGHTDDMSAISVQHDK